MNFSEAMFYLTSDFHTNTVISNLLFFRSDVLWKLFDIGFPYKHCYFKPVIFQKRCFMKIIWHRFSIQTLLFQTCYFSEAMFYENYLTSDFHTNTVISNLLFFRSDVLWKLFDIGFPYEHCYFKPVIFRKRCFMKIIWHRISIQTLLFQACLPTRQNGVENRDKAYSRK